MIMPINNIQPKATFQGVKFKTPIQHKPTNKSNFMKKTSDKMSKFIDKTKSEFKNMDEETRDLLFKVVIGYTFLSVVIGTIIHYVSKIVDNFKNLF